MNSRSQTPIFHASFCGKIDRPRYLADLSRACGRSPVTALLGPRQCGRTTLARELAKGSKHRHFDLESRPDVARLTNPELALGDLRGLVVIDEIQTRPEFFEVLRVPVDRPDNEATFLVLGSASPDIVRGASETLAGRVDFVELSGFDLSETEPESVSKPWVGGGFPRSEASPHAGSAPRRRDHYPDSARRNRFSCLSHATSGSAHIARATAVPKGRKRTLRGRMPTRNVSVRASAATPRTLQSKYGCCRSNAP